MKLWALVLVATATLALLIGVQLPDLLTDIAWFALGSVATLLAVMRAVVTHQDARIFPSTTPDETIATRFQG